MSVLKIFGRVSEYKLNLSKSELFPINKAAEKLSYTQFLFKLAGKSDLGGVVTMSVLDLFKTNFKPRLARTINDFSLSYHLP